MAPPASKQGPEGDHNPWAPPVPDLLTDEPSPQELADEPDPSEQPPQYSDAHGINPRTSPTNTLNPRTPLPLPQLPLHLYEIPESTISTDRVTITSRHAPFYHESDTLFTFLKDQATLPPKPVLHILGTHKTYQGTVIDFDLTLNLTPLLHQPTGQQWNYLKFPSPPSSATQATTTPTTATKHTSTSTSQTQIQTPTPPQDLPTLSHAFTTDPSPNKSLTLTRHTTNLDTSYLHGQILALLARSLYRGTVTVSFRDTYSSIVIQKGSPLAQTWRSALSTAASWITAGKAPVGKQSTSYGVEVVWPFATGSPAAEEGGRQGEGGGDGVRRRRCAVQSEVEWWRTWSGAIRNAVLAGRRGWVGSEDWVEVGMGWKAEEKKGEWGASDGGAGGGR